MAWIWQSLTFEKNSGPAYFLKRTVKKHSHFSHFFKNKNFFGGMVFRFLKLIVNATFTACLYIIFFSFFSQFLYSISFNSFLDFTLFHFIFICLFYLTLPFFFFFFVLFFLFLKCGSPFRLYVSFLIWIIVPYPRKEVSKNAKDFQVFPNNPRKIPGKFHKNS